MIPFVLWAIRTLHNLIKKSPCKDGECPFSRKHLTIQIGLLRLFRTITDLCPATEFGKDSCRTHKVNAECQVLKRYI